MRHGGDGSGTHNISRPRPRSSSPRRDPGRRGNRGLSSKSGSAEVLAQLGVNIDAEFPLVEQSSGRPVSAS
jgi:anthranilate phosphoribosyltransferase